MRPTRTTCNRAWHRPVRRDHAPRRPAICNLQSAFCIPVLAALVLLAPAGALAEDARPPAAAWVFGAGSLPLVRDVAAGRHHATAQAPLQAVPSPGGQALVFDGRAAWLRVPHHPDLVATDTVTVDAWVWIDSLDTPQPQCLVDKGGERYRLQIQGDTPTFGLKGNDDARLDVSGGKLTAAAWHRVTGVFRRPTASLYLDGKIVATKEWDHAIGPGGDLFLGSKGGVTYFLKGRLDEVRIYREARPPLPADAPSTAGDGRPAVNLRLQMTETPGGVTVDTGAVLVELTDAGVLRSLAVGERRVVAGNTAPLLAASVLQSKEYDGRRDYAPGQVLEAVYRPAGHTYKREDRTFRASFTGALEFPGGDRIECTTTVAATAGSPFLTLATRLDPRGAFQDRFVRSVALRLPLALSKRKRVVQAGDRGVQWNTRHWYQFHADPTMHLMPEPEHNLWRTFAIDQHTAGDYHIWRAESPATAPLSMQRGIAAAGWMAAYDEAAGILFAYQGMERRAPKSLRVDAEGAGTAAVYLWSPSEPAIAPAAPEARALFGAAHTTDWLPFADDFRFARPDRYLAAHWGVGALASDPPARNRIPAPEPAIASVPAADAEAPLVSGAVPFPRGALRDPAAVRLRADGKDVPLQTRPTAFWPDASIKWLLLTFPPAAGTAAPEQSKIENRKSTIPFFLTRRDGSQRPYTLEYGEGIRLGRPATVLQARREGDVISINTGPLQIEVAQAAGWLRRVGLNGKEMVAPAGVRSFVHFLRPEGTYPGGTTHAAGALDDGEFLPASIALEEDGPLRAVVRLEGMTGAREPTRMVIRLEAYAGRSVVRVFQSAEFLHKDPRAAFVRGMGLELPVDALRGARVVVGGQDGPVVLPAGAYAGIRQHSHLGYRAWHQAAGERFPRTDEREHRCRGWLDMSGPAGGVAVVLRDMWQQFPNELAADTGRGRLTVGFWPESAPVMDVRRYSNYPHRSQGESAGSASNWVAEEYYPKDPFVGVSKTHEALLFFHGPALAAGRVDAVAADFQRPPLVFPPAQWTHHCGVLLPHTVPDPKRFARADANLEHLARFWTHHQRLWGWYGMWDYGDVQHYFQGGYGSIVGPEALAKALKEKPGADVRAVRLQDYSPGQEWAFDNGRWGWGNTEGLPGLYMQTQYLRTGDRDLYFFIEAMARHVRDVDMRHDGIWLGQGTRHGVQHWSDGNHEERQTTHSEFRYHYCLSGEGRSRDFARLLYDKVYSQRGVSIHAAHSGRLQGILSQWEMTGSPEVGTLLEKYVPCFFTPQGLCESPDVQFPDVQRVAATRDVNAGNMFFWSFGAGHGLLEYFDLTGSEALKQALIKTADDAIARGDMREARKAVIFAAAHAPDPEPYRRFLRQWIEKGGYRALLSVVPHNPALYAGPGAFLAGGVSGSWFRSNDMPSLMTVLDGDPPLTEAQAAEVKQADEVGGTPYAAAYLSWQSEYDRPEFQEYLKIKHPQP